MTDNQLRDNAQKMLKELEDNGIVPTLRALGIKGYPRSATSCAISQYLTETVGGEWYTCQDYSIGDNGDDSAYTLDISPAVAKFIMGFDSGEYPELVG